MIRLSVPHEEYWSLKQTRASYRRTQAAAYSATNTAVEALRRGDHAVAEHYLQIALNELRNGSRQDPVTVPPVVK